MEPDQLDVRLMQEPPMAWPDAPALWPWAAGIAILLIGLLWAVRRIRNRRVRRPTHAAMRRSPAASAREALDRLRQEDRVRSGPAEPLYRAMSAIVRTYIEEQHGAGAPRLTTEEFLSRAAEGQAIPAEVRARIGRFLEACDLVKFARREPGVAEREQAWQAAGAIMDGEGKEDAGEASP